jgi:hypothetical protein
MATLGAVFKVLALEAGQAAGNIAAWAARLAEHAADVEEANVASLFDADARAARRFAEFRESGDGRAPAGPMPGPREPGIPLGFADPIEFQAFADVLTHGLADAGFRDTEAAFQGSSVTGISFVKGLPFRPDSDYDIALGGPDIFAKARELGVPLRSAGTRTGPLSDKQIEAFGLSAMRAQLMAMGGHEVNFMVYQDIGSALRRSPSLRVGG